MQILGLVVALTMFTIAVCKPLEGTEAMDQKVHHMWKRFVNTALTSGYFNDNYLSRIRTKRGADDECEKLQLCKMHARSSRNFLAAYELYFVSKENAKLWDHQAHSATDCERRYSGCYGSPEPAPQRSSYRSYRNDDYDYNY